MASFKDNDKISYDDLAPSLQAMLKRSVSKDDLESFKNKVAEIEAKLNGIRLSVVNDVASIPNPQNNKEIAIVLGPKYTFMCTYNNGWQKVKAVYA